jgi:hypothetical protein
MKRTWRDWLWDTLLVIVALFAMGIILSGCATTTAVLPARTAIPVECKEPKPERPAMPTDNLQPDAPLDASVQAMQAEIALREGYEGQLVTALDACTAPIKR